MEQLLYRSATLDLRIQELDKGTKTVPVYHTPGANLYRPDNALDPIRLGSVGKIVIPGVFPDGCIHKVLLKGACKLNEKNRAFGIIPDYQVRFEVSRAEMMWWSVLLGGKVHSYVVVLAPVTGSKVVMEELCNLTQNCIMPCIVTPLFESNRVCTR